MYGNRLAGTCTSIAPITSIIIGDEAIRLLLIANRIDLILIIYSLTYKLQHIAVRSHRRQFHSPR